MLHCTDPIKAVFICPLFFGAAHIHRIMEQFRMGVSLKAALFSSSKYTIFTILRSRSITFFPLIPCIGSVSVFQFIYTTIFGAYSAFLFVRTGHFIAPMLCHSFCNMMGFPNFAGLSEFAPRERMICAISFVAGLVLWGVLLYPLTNPQYYHNNLPWSTFV